MDRNVGTPEYGDAMPDEPSGQHDPGPTGVEEADIVDAVVEEAEPAGPAPSPPTPPIAAIQVAVPEDPGYSRSGIPTFEAVREKIETRYVASLGSTELDAATPEGRSIEERYAAREKAAAERLEQIRASMHLHGADDPTSGDR